MRDDGELTAVVIAGAVARGPYEAGALAALIPRVLPDLSNTVFIGTSAGAINAVLWARYAHLGVIEAGNAVEDVWRSIDYRKVLQPLICTLLARNPILGTLGFITGHGLPSLLDAQPLRDTVERELDSDQIARNLEQGLLRAVGVVATASGNMVASSRSHVFLQALADDFRAVTLGKDSSIDFFPTTLGSDHILASTAVPGLFQPIRLTAGEFSQMYVDGGVRLNTPIAPAIAMGAKRVIVVSSHTAHYGANEDTPKAFGMVDSFARLLHTVSADAMIEDLRTLRRLNMLVEQYGQNGQMPTYPGGRSYRTVELIVVSPQPGALAAKVREALKQGWFDCNKQRYRLLRTLARVGGAGEGRDELLSYFLFDPTFAQRQFDLGHEDASELSGWEN